MRHYFWATVFSLGALMTGCGGSQFSPTAAPAATGENLVVATATIETIEPAVTASAGAQPTTLPTASPLAGPRFDPGILFAPAADPSKATTQFPAGTKQVYALWTYHGMTEGMIVRRIWFRNSAMWIRVEEPWDYSKYGAEGMMMDVSIYDFEQGLSPGRYRLDLYIDGLQQFTSDKTSRTFDIAESVPSSGGLVSPDGKRMVVVEPIDRIAIKEGSGDWRTLVEAHEIIDMAWFLDSRHLVYTDERDTGSGPPVSKTHDLWIVDVDTGQTRQIDTAQESLLNAAPSPDGKTLAVLIGGGYGDACMVSLSLGFLTLDADFQRTGFARMEEFAGFPHDPSFESIYPAHFNGQLDGEPLGVWDSPTILRAELLTTCTETQTFGGEYTFDLVTMSMKRTGDLSEAP